MNAFELTTPRSRAETLGLLANYGAEARLLAGGTGLINLLKLGMARPARLLSLHALRDMSDIAVDSATLHIGALDRLLDIERNVEVRAHWPVLGMALRELASPRVRSMATLGGAVAHGDPNQDLPAVLIALDAVLEVAELHGQREVPLGGFYKDYYETALAPTELICGVRLPRAAPGSRAVFLKFAPRSAEDYATVSVCCRLDRDIGTGRVLAARVVMGGVGATILRSTAAEAELTGAVPDAAVIASAAAIAARATDPLTDTRGTAAYKRAMAEVFVRRALTQLLEP